MTDIELQELIDGKDGLLGDSAYATFSGWVQGRRIHQHLARREWEPFPDEIDLAIIRACGYTDVDDAVNNFRSETRQTLKMLAGPNAWTIYKMLKAQHE